MSSDTVSYVQVQKMNRFARYWDLIGNSGRFKNSLPLLLSDQPFFNFQKFTEALFDRTGQTHKISLLRLYDFMFDIAVEEFAVDENAMRMVISGDFENSGLKSIPKSLRAAKTQTVAKQSVKRHNSRQARH